MKFVICVVALALSGCASQPSPQVLAFQAYIEQSRPLAVSGAIKWSEYLTGLYQKSAAIPVPPWHLKITSNLIDQALKFERGEITEAEFSRLRREAQISAMTEENAERQRTAATQQAASAALIESGTKLMQSAGPYTLTPSQPAQSSPAFTIGNLQSQSINGTLRYCKYSNGVVTTISVTSLCPLTNQ